MENKDYIEFTEFSRWINLFPFFRSYFRECMKPKIWGLQNQDATIATTRKTALTRPKGQSGASCISISQNKNDHLLTESRIIKQGYLLKVGQLTDLMQERWYVLRDQALFIYNSRGQRIPTQIIPLVGLQICKLSPENNNHRLAICNEISKSYPLKVLYHEDFNVINDWVNKLKEQAQNLCFHDQYQIITEIGIGLSTVFKCRNKATQEVLAVKQIHKPNLTDQGRRRLREEIYVGCSLSHKHVVEIKEIYECDSYVYIIMERVPGGDLQVYFNKYSLSERQVSLVMHQLL